MTYARPKEAFEEPLASLPESDGLVRWRWPLILGLIALACGVIAWLLWEVMR